MCVLLPTANQLAFPVCSGLSDVHECSGGLQVVIGEKQPGYNSSHNCLMICIDLATFCDTLSAVGPCLGSFGGANSQHVA